jgi:hypothetical protein
MALSFLASSHRQWILRAKASLQDKAHALDTAIHVQHANLLLTEIMHKVAKKIGFRQRVICTALVFFKRFYIT